MVKSRLTSIFFVDVKHIGYLVRCPCLDLVECPSISDTLLADAPFEIMQVYPGADVDMHLTDDINISMVCSDMGLTNPYNMKNPYHARYGFSFFG